MRRGYLRNQIVGEVGPMEPAEDETQANQAQPEQEARPADERTNHRQQRGQKPVGGRTAASARQTDSTGGSPIAAGQFDRLARSALRCRQHIEDDEIRAVQLGQQPNHIILTRRLVAQRRRRGFPDRPHTVPAVHQTDQVIGRRSKPVKPLRRAILQDIPGPSAVLVSRQMTAQPRVSTVRRDTRTR